MAELATIGLGKPAGEVLRKCTTLVVRSNEHHWAVLGGGTIPHNLVERCVEQGFLVIQNSGFKDKEGLSLTEKGWAELSRFAGQRALELSAKEGDAHRIDPSDYPQTRAEMVRELTGLAFEARERSEILLAGDDEQKRSEVFMRRLLEPTILLQVGEAAPVELSEFMKASTSHAERMRRAFVLLKVFSEGSLFGLTIGEMHNFVQWASVVASQLFLDAPNQDWEFGEGEE